MSYIVPKKIPNCCAECAFHSAPEEFPVKDRLYKKISRCLLAPQEIEDAYRDIAWQCEHKEKWCPLIEIPETIEVQSKRVSNSFEARIHYAACQALKDNKYVDKTHPAKIDKKRQGRI